MEIGQDLVESIGTGLDGLLSLTWQKDDMSDFTLVGAIRASGAENISEFVIQASLYIVVLDIQTRFKDLLPIDICYPFQDLDGRAFTEEVMENVIEYVLASSIVGDVHIQEITIPVVNFIRNWSHLYSKLGSPLESVTMRDDLIMQIVTCENQKALERELECNKRWETNIAAITSNFESRIANLETLVKYCIHSASDSRIDTVTTRKQVETEKLMREYVTGVLLSSVSINSDDSSYTIYPSQSSCSTCRCKY